MANEVEKKPKKGAVIVEMVSDFRQWGSLSKLLQNPTSVQLKENLGGTVTV
jgi:hypothetical protein